MLYFFSDIQKFHFKHMFHEKGFERNVNRRSNYLSCQSARMLVIYQHENITHISKIAEQKNRRHLLIQLNIINKKSLCRNQIKKISGF